MVVGHDGSHFEGAKLLNFSFMECVDNLSMGASVGELSSWGVGCSCA